MGTKNRTAEPRKAPYDAKLQAVFEEHAHNILQRDDVTSISMGFAHYRGRVTKTKALCIHVSRKWPPATLKQRWLTPFPREIDGVRVDVVESNMRLQYQSDTEIADRTMDPAKTIRPGVMISVGGGAGTVGLLVYKDKALCILSAGHVMVNKGMDVHQPTLRSPIVGRVFDIDHPELDAAVCACSRKGLNRPYGRDDLLINNYRAPRFDRPETLTMSGGMTGLTTGLVVSSEGLYQYKESGRVVTGFQLRSAPNNTAPISQEGDSGGVWFDEGGYAVGLHVAGDPSAGWAFACPMPDIIENMGLTIA